MRWGSTAVLGVAALLLACGEDVSVYEAHGVVEDVQPEYGQLVVAHEDIPGLMPAMTMNFDVADPTLLERLERGDAIEFELEVRPRSYRIASARVVGRSEVGGGEAETGIATGAAAPPFRLVDHTGSEVSLEDLRGKAVVLDFVYTRCPGPCPILTGIQVDVQRSLPEDVRALTHFVSISLDPDHDTPEVLARYARRRGADLLDWSFLTGERETVSEVVRSYGVGSVRAPDGTIDHLTVTFLIDPEGRIADRFVGLDHEPEAIRAALERILS